MSESYRSPDGRNHTLWESISDAMDALLPAYGSQTAARREARGWIFRGQSDATWKLAPTLYREPFGPSDVEVAGYFASSSNPTNASVGVIYCFNVDEYRQMCNPFAALGATQEYAEEQMRAGGLTPLPPLRTVQLRNVPRILQQKAVFLEVHEEHKETVMHNCGERFYFKQGRSYSGGTQSKLWMLPDRSNFGSDVESAAFLYVAKAQRSDLFEGTPYVGHNTMFPDGDYIRRFVDEWKREYMQ